ncbi:MAG TPA: arginase [Anaerolineae bacterium]|nr:arginase [Anaerolineae bacterium]
MVTKKIRILGVPMDLGQNRRGVDMGPSAARYAGLQKRLEELGHVVVDHGNVVVPNREEQVAEGKARRLAAVTNVCQAIYDIGRASIAEDEFPIFLGGDHSISIGTIAAVSKQEEPLGVIWVDAHGDFNTPDTSPSGNIHGMPVSVLVGDGPDELVNLGHAGAKVYPANIVQIGIRELDVHERLRLQQTGIQVITMRHIDEWSMARAARQALDRLRHLKRIHVSFDMDSLDPAEAPGVGTPVPGGLSYREAHLLMEILGDSNKITSLDIVEINPILDDRNRTGELAVGLAASLLGQRIL